MMSESEIQHKTRLHEVSVIRPIIILSLVLNHSFVKIASGGLRRNDYQLPDIYQWVNWFNFDCTLESFTMISGYVFAFQCITLQRRYSFGEFAMKKAHRLLLPMLVFGVVYYFCFLYRPDKFTIADFLMKLFSGYGHLWFLPMLFWCLLGLWIIDRFQFNKWLTLGGLAAISFVSWLPLPFGLARCLHFMFYTYFGYSLYANKSLIKEKMVRPSFVFMLWLAYITSVIMWHVILHSIRLFSVVVCSLGILALYTTVVKHIEVPLFKLSSMVKKADRLSFGIYIYHQFILVALYHYTSIGDYTNEYVIPWIGFVVALFISTLFATITLHTRIGRYLIG